MAAPSDSDGFLLIRNHRFQEAKKTHPVITKKNDFLEFLHLCGGLVFCERFTAKLRIKLRI